MFLECLEMVLDLELKEQSYACMNEGWYMD